MNRLYGSLAAFALFLFIAFPLNTFAANTTFFGPIVPACGSNGGVVGANCNVCDLVVLIQNLINFIVSLSVLVATALFAYAGILMVTAGGDMGKVETAKGIFTNVVIGFVVILAAWLIVDTMMKTFLKVPGQVGSLGPWNKVLCPAGFQPTTPVGTPTTNGSSGGVSVGGVKDGRTAEQKAADEARVRAALGSNITVNRAACAVGQASTNANPCTDVGLLSETAVGDLHAIQQGCNCSLVLTGGTEAGPHSGTGSCSHTGGGKFDIRATSEVTSYITKNPQSGTRSDGATLYKDRNTGTVWAKESDHWDVSTCGV